MVSPFPVMIFISDVPVLPPAASGGARRCWPWWQRGCFGVRSATVLGWLTQFGGAGTGFVDSDDVHRRSACLRPCGCWRSCSASGSIHAWRLRRRAGISSSGH